MSYDMFVNNMLKPLCDEILLAKCSSPIISNLLNFAPQCISMARLTKWFFFRLQRTMLVVYKEQCQWDNSRRLWDRTGLFRISSLCLLTIFKEIFSSILDFTDLPTISKPLIVHKFLKIHFQQSPKLPSQLLTEFSTKLHNLWLRTKWRAGSDTDTFVKHFHRKYSSQETTKLHLQCIGLLQSHFPKATVSISTTSFVKARYLCKSCKN